MSARRSPECRGRARADSDCTTHQPVTQPSTRASAHGNAVSSVKIDAADASSVARGGTAGSGASAARRAAQAAAPAASELTPIMTAWDARGHGSGAIVDGGGQSSPLTPSLHVLETEIHAQSGQNAQKIGDLLLLDELFAWALGSASPSLSSTDDKPREAAPPTTTSLVAMPDFRTRTGARCCREAAGQRALHGLSLPEARPRGTTVVPARRSAVRGTAGPKAAATSMGEEMRKRLSASAPRCCGEWGPFPRFGVESGTSTSKFHLPLNRRLARRPQPTCAPERGKSTARMLTVGSLIDSDEKLKLELQRANDQNETSTLCGIPDRSAPYPPLGNA